MSENVDVEAFNLEQKQIWDILFARFLKCVYKPIEERVDRIEEKLKDV